MGHRRLALGMAGMVVLGAGSIRVEPAGAGGLRFEASALAQGARLGFLVPGATVVDQPIDGGGPVAFAAVDSLGNSNGLAAQPYPGEMGIIGPALVASLAGLPQPPAYPFYAATRYPGTTDAEAALFPGYHVQAHSSEGTSDAKARSGMEDKGGKVFLSEAAARVHRHGDSVRAESTNRFEGLAIGPLAIGSVTSMADVSRSGGADTDRKSALSVNGLAVAGQAVGIGEGGLVTPGSATPLPPSDPLVTTLAQAGVSVRYLKAQSTDSGVIAPGLQVTLTREIPGAGRTGTLSLILGQAAASVTATTDEAALPADAPVPEAEAAPAAEPTPAAADAPTVVPGPTPAAPVAVGVPVAPTHRAATAPARLNVAGLEVAAPALVEAGAPAAAEAAEVPAVVAVAPKVVRLARAGAALGYDAGSSVYPILLVAGALALAGLQLVRLVEVKK